MKSDLSSGSSHPPADAEPPIRDAEADQVNERANADSKATNESTNLHTLASGSTALKSGPSNDNDATKTVGPVQTPSPPEPIHTNDHIQNDILDREVLELSHMGHMNRGTCLENMESIVRARFEQTGRIQDLEVAIELCREALELRSVEQPERIGTLNNLASAVFARARRMGKVQDLDEAVEFLREAVILCFHGKQDTSRSLRNLACVLHTRFEQAGKLPDLDEAISLYRELLDLCPDGHPNRIETLSDLTDIFHTRFKRMGQMRDLEEMISFIRTSLESCPPGHPDRCMSLNHLAYALLTRFDQLAWMPDLEEAITTQRETLELCPHGDPSRSIELNNLAAALRKLFDRVGGIQVLDEAIGFYREAITLFSPGDPQRNKAVNSLASAVHLRFHEMDKIQDLEDAISFHHEALELCPPGHPDRSKNLDALASELRLRFKKTGKIQDLHDAVDLQREALELLPVGHPELSETLNNLAVSLQTRSLHIVGVQDLNEAVELLYQAIAMRPPGHPGRGRTLKNLPIVLQSRFEQTGRIQDLDEATGFSREALELCPPGNAERGSMLGSLALFVHTRFDQMGEIQDVEEAIDLTREALELCPPGTKERGMILNDLASSVHARFQQIGREDDLDEAIDLYHEALKLLSPGDPDRRTIFNNMASIMHTRFKRTGQAQDEDEMISFYRKALELCPPGHPRRGGTLISLSSVLMVHTDTDPRALAAHLSDARASLPDLHPFQARATSKLAELYLKQYDRGQQNLQSLDTIFKLLRDSSSHPTAKITDRLETASKWALLARKHNHESEMDAYAAALALFNQASVMVSSLDDQHTAIPSRTDSYRSLASDAASSAIEAGRPDLAVQFLEQGRAVLWSRMRGYRSPLVELSEVKPDLAEEFMEISHQLELQAISHSVKLQPKAPTLHEKQEQKYRRLSEKWDEVVQKIREVEGFGDFLRPASFDTLRKAALEGPVIIVNISEYRSDAIIVLHDVDPLVAPLPDASPAALSKLASLFAGPQANASPDFSKGLVTVLRALWKLVVQPVTEKLGEIGVPKKSRIWWCPTSELCGLPIHAAGPYKPGQKSFPDLYIPSYVANLAALKSARSNIKVMEPTATHSPLIVAPLDDGLECVEEEVCRIKKICSCDSLTGLQATPSTVLSSLQKHPWVHFACHGHKNPQTFHSSFQLHGGERMELLDIMKAKLPNAELAFLSACHGAAVDQNAPNESINLASALQFCGFRSVVGTLWAMKDEDGPIVAETFYAHMFRDTRKADFRDAATAINRATRELRKKNVELGRWVNFIHIGA